MYTPTDKHEAARSSGQILPGSGIHVAVLRKLAAELRRAHSGKLSPEIVAAAVASLLPAPTPEADSRAEVETLDLPAPLARVTEIILREVQMFKHAGDDLVEVVLTPDVKTQITLRLQWREGQMEALAQCDLGDYPALSAHWPQLQAKLAGHGVRLTPLTQRVPTGFTDYFNNPNFAPPHLGDRGGSGQTEPGNTVATSPRKFPRPVSFRKADNRRRLLDSRL
jgi:hypothetical protein